MSELFLKLFVKFSDIGSNVIGPSNDIKLRN